MELLEKFAQGYKVDSQETTVTRMCPKCVHSSPFQSHTRGIGVRMWLI